MAGHPQPPWAHKPQHHEWALVEIKDGVEVAVHKLDRASTVLGRAADQVDIPLSHESASRHHARIAFDRTGTPWLRDLQSTHGVTINKKRFPVAAIGRDESNGTKPGSRGVVMYPGDVLQFGASTRIYCLDGPEEFSREAIRKPADEVNVGTSGVSMPEPDDSDYDESATNTTPLTDDVIPEQHLKEWEKLKALQYKLENVNTESERIRVKADLSVGQERQLERNDERAKQLQEQIQEKEAELNRKVHPEEKQRRDGHNEGGLASNDDEMDGDDYFDRTKPPSDVTQFEFSKDGESEKSLLIKWNSLQERKESLITEVDKKRQQIVLLEQRVAQMQVDADSEAFFAQNDLDLASETYRKLQAKIKELDGNMLATKELISVANPNLRLTDGAWTTKSDTPRTAVQEENGNGETKRKLANERKRSTNSTAPSDVIGERGDTTTAIAAPPRKKNRHDIESISMPPHIVLQRSKPATTSTAATLALLYPSALQADDSRATSAPVPAATSASDGKVDVWQAPRDQDGSGITKLNAKFAGRY